MTYHSRKAFTIMEVMMAVALGSFIAAIGFTGINAFGKAVTRSKQFTAQTQIITACLRYSARRGDAINQNSLGDSPVPTPKSYPTTTVSGNLLEFETTISSAQVGGDVRKGLQANSANKNSILIKAIMAYQ